MNVETTPVRTKDGALTVRDHSLVVVLMDGRDQSVNKVIKIYVKKKISVMKACMKFIDTIQLKFIK